ncbi:MAG: pilus assembly protein PilP [Polyangiaceae bacterium]
MSRSARLPAVVVLAAVLVPAVIIGCEDPPPPPPPPGRNPVLLASASASASASVTPVVYNESDFTVSDRNRDPFRGYPELFAASSARTKSNIQQKIVADNFSLDELKLVAIVSGGTAARAMMVDPSGKGHIVTRGELIGRTESVRSAGQGSSEYDVTWKVERIREGDVIFVREIPGASTPIATRVIALRPEGDAPIPRRLSTHSHCTNGPPVLSSHEQPEMKGLRQAQVGFSAHLGLDAHANGAPFFDRSQ